MEIRFKSDTDLSVSEHAILKAALDNCFRIQIGTRGADIVVKVNEVPELVRSEAHVSAIAPAPVSVERP